MFFLVARKSWLIYLLPPVGKYQKTNIFYRAHTNRIDVQIVVSKYPEWLFFTILIIVIDTTRFRLFDLNTSQRKVPQNYRYTRSINYPNPHNSPTNTNEIHPDKHPPPPDISFFSQTNQPKLFAPKKHHVYPRVRQFLLIALLTPLPSCVPSCREGKKQKRKEKRTIRAQIQIMCACVCVSLVRAKNYAPLFFLDRRNDRSTPPLLLSSSPPPLHRKHGCSTRTIRG